MRNVKFSLVSCAVLTFSSALFAADNEVSATPSRPTVASGASISEAGWVEIELGMQRTRDTLSGAAENRDALPYLAKYSFDKRWALWLGGDAAIRDEGAGSTMRGVGDTTVTLKHKFSIDNEKLSAGFEAAIKLPTADESKGLGSGEKDFGLKGIYGVDLPAGLHLDTNLGATRYGLETAGVSRTGYLWAVALSRPVSEKLTLAADLSGTRQTGVPSTRQLMLAGSYAISKRIVADAGMQWGLNDNSPDWTAFAGVTLLLGKIQ